MATSTRRPGRRIRRSTSGVASAVSMPGRVEKDSNQPAVVALTPWLSRIVGIQLRVA